MRLFRFAGCWVLVVLCSLLPLAGAEAPAIVRFILKNGDRLSGQVLQETGDSIRLRTDWGGEFTLNKDRIAHREKLDVSKPDSTTAENKADGKAAQPATVVSGSSTNHAGTNSVVVGKWKGEAQVGLDVTRNRTSSQLYSARLKLAYLRGPWHNQFDYKLAYGKTDGQLSANLMNGAFKSDLDVGKSKEFFVYNIGSAGFDELRKVRLEYEEGPGVGYHAVTRTNFVFNLESGAAYQYQSLTDNSTQSDFRMRYAENFTWKVAPKVTFEEKMEILPRVDSPANFRYRTELTFRINLLQNLYFTITALNLYDSHAAAGVPPNDLQIHSALGVTF